MQDAIHLNSRLPSSVVFETEKVFDSHGSKRIRFFHKQGAELCPLEYYQPSLSDFGSAVNLHLMYHPIGKFRISTREWLRIIKSIYRDVYGIKNYEREEAFHRVLEDYGVCV